MSEQFLALAPISKKIETVFTKTDSGVLWFSGQTVNKLRGKLTYLSQVRMPNTPSPFELLAKRNVQVCGVVITVINKPNAGSSEVGVKFPDDFQGTVEMSNEFAHLGSCVSREFPRVKVGRFLHIKDEMYDCEVEVLRKMKNLTKYKICFHTVETDEDPIDEDPS
jgi:hypothetical protein